MWIGNQTLANSFPALFSHTIRPNASVAHALSLADLRLLLRSRLTSATQSELLLLHDILVTATLDHVRSDRRTIWGSTSAAPSLAAVIPIRSRTSRMTPSPSHLAQRCPPKCRTFLWEVHQHKLNTNYRLHRRGSNNDGLCLFCGGSEDVPSLPSCSGTWDLYWLTNKLSGPN